MHNDIPPVTQHDLRVRYDLMPMPPRLQAYDVPARPRRRFSWHAVRCDILTVAKLVALAPVALLVICAAPIWNGYFNRKIRS